MGQYSTKPQVAKAVLSEPGIKEALAGKLLISICAGVTIDQLESWTTPTTTVIRAMPNTPCKVLEQGKMISGDSLLSIAAISYSNLSMLNNRSVKE